MKKHALKARVADERDSVWYDELTRLNNDLATAHREQAKTAVELAPLERAAKTLQHGAGTVRVRCFA